MVSGGCIPINWVLLWHFLWRLWHWVKRLWPYSCKTTYISFNINLSSAKLSCLHETPSFPSKVSSHYHNRFQSVRWFITVVKFVSLQPFYWNWLFIGCVKPYKPYIVDLFLCIPIVSSDLSFSALFCFSSVPRTFLQLFNKSFLKLTRWIHKKMKHWYLHLLCAVTSSNNIETRDNIDDKHRMRKNCIASTEMCRSLITPEL